MSADAMVRTAMKYHEMIIESATKKYNQHLRDASSGTNQQKVGSGQKNGHKREKDVSLTWGS